MKKKKIVFAFLSLFLIVSVIAIGKDDPVNFETKETMPEKVKVVIDKSCFGCHNTGSKNEDAKEELDFKKLDGLSKIKKISAYKHIGETISKGEMPPKKFLQKFPEKSLTDVEKELLMNWAKKEANALVKK